MAMPTPATSPSKLTLDLNDISTDWHFHVSKIAFEVDGAFFKEIIGSVGTFAEALQTIISFWVLGGAAYTTAKLGDMHALGTWLTEQTFPAYNDEGVIVAPPVEDPPAFGSTPPYDGESAGWGSSEPPP